MESRAANRRPGPDGRMATSPTEIPALAWKDILLRVWRGVGRNHIALTAAGVAFYGLLALFPAIAAVAGMAGLVLTPQDITNQIDKVTRVVPADAASIILDQAKAIAASGNTGLGIATLLGLTISIYSASKGVQSLMEGINIAYDESETRGFLRLSLTRFALTAFLVIGMVAGLGTTMVIPSLLAIVDLGPTMEALVTLIRWLVLFVMTIVGLMVLFRFGPDRRPARWRSPRSLLGSSQRLGRAGVWLTSGAVHRRDVARMH